MFEVRINLPRYRIDAPNVTDETARRLLLTQESLL
jgi:hypothetical protein